MTSFPLGPGLPCDLPKLTDTRLLVQANSGGGKSWVLRRLLEQTHGQIQHLVIDPEGEFASLRERFDYVYAARHGGDTAAEPRAAKLLAERLLELNVSAILDIYELKAQDRILFVKAFVEALVEAPKKLWHPALVLIDEAHVYCPQKGEAVSAESVIDLATRGRKRGFCAVLATQRLSKLHKDAAAELNNKLIGRTGLDVDIDRAADELGFNSRDQRHQLRALEPGEFFAFGPALPVGFTRFRVGPVKTTHPKAGSRIAFTPPPPTAKVRALLPQLADLPAEAEEKHKSFAALQQELSTVRRQLTLAQRAGPAPITPERVEVPVLSAVERAELEKVSAQLSELKDALPAVERELTAAFGQARAQLAEYGADLSAAVNEFLVTFQRSIRPKLEAAGRPPSRDQSYHTPRPTLPPSGFASSETIRRLEDQRGLRAGARRILEAVARRYPAPTTEAQAGQLAGLARTGGTFSTYLSDIAKGGYAVRERGELQLTDLGWQVIGKEPGSCSPQTTEEVLSLYDGVLRAGARRMLQILMDEYPGGIDRAELGARSEVAQSGGTFSTYLSDLRKAGLVEETREGVKASALLMNPAEAR